MCRDITSTTAFQNLQRTGYVDGGYTPEQQAALDDYNDLYQALSESRRKLENLEDEVADYTERLDCLADRLSDLGIPVGYGQDLRCSA